MRLKVYYEDGEAYKIQSLTMSLDVELDGNTAIFNDPMMQLFSDDAMDEFVEDVESLSFVEETSREYDGLPLEDTDGDDSE